MTGANAKNRSAVLDRAATDVEDQIEISHRASSAKFSTRSTAKRRGNNHENGKIEAQESGTNASDEQRFGLRRVSFMLPEALADKLNELGGAAWIMSLLSGETDTIKPTPVKQPMNP